MGRLCLIALLLFFVSLSRCDECTFAKGSFPTADALYACFNRIPSQYQRDTLRQLRSLSSVYSFGDLSKNSGPPFNIQVDLDAELSRMESTQYPNDYRFEEDVSRTLNRLGDAHTLYAVPTGYRSFAVAFPFLLTAVRSGNALIPKIDDEMSIDRIPYSTLCRVPLTKYVGLSIVNIDGVSSQKWLQDAADRLGTSRDRGARLNNLLTRYLMMRALGFRADLPLVASELSSSSSLRDSASRNYTFEFSNGDVAQVPKVFYANTQYTDLNDFLKSGVVRSPVETADEAADLRRLRFRLSGVSGEETKIPTGLPSAERSATSEEIRRRQRHVVFEDPFADAKDLAAHISGAARQTAAPAAAQPSPSLSSRSSAAPPKKSAELPYDDVASLRSHIGRVGSGAAADRSSSSSSSSSPSLIVVNATADGAAKCWRYSDDSAVVLRLSSFMVNYTALDSSQLFNDLIQQCFTVGSQRAIPNLLVDVRSNGGGLICLATNAYQAFSPVEWDSRRPSNARYVMEPYDLRKSTVVTTAVSRGALIGERLDPLTGYSLDDKNTSWYTAASYTRSRGGGTSDYSPKSYFPAECFNRVDLFAFEKSPVANPFNRTILLTDGLCGSACALFAGKLRFYGKALIVAKGGLPTDDMETASFSGGNVVEWDDFVAEVGNASLVDYLPTKARARFTFNENYFGDSALPREFVRMAPDFRILKWDFSADGIYTQIDPSQTALDDAKAFFDDPSFVAKLKPLGNSWTPRPFDQQSDPTPPPPPPSSGAAKRTATTAVLWLLTLCVVAAMMITAA